MLIHARLSLGRDTDLGHRRCTSRHILCHFGSITERNFEAVKVFRINCIPCWKLRASLVDDAAYKGKVDPNMSLVAIPSHVFDKYGQAQNNKLCGKIITMTYQGVTRKAVVADENTSGE